MGQLKGLSTGMNFLVQVPVGLVAKRVCLALSLLVAGYMAVAFPLPCRGAEGSIDDPLDGQPLGWRLVTSDTQAQVQAHWVDGSGGENGRACEAMSIVAGNGTEAILEYRLDPSLALDDVAASVAIRSLRPGARVGLRIRFPRTLDPQTRQPLATYVWGDFHPGRGEWTRLAVRMTGSQANLREAALRGRFGAEADPSDAFIDAVVINGYTGAGVSTLGIDNLKVEGLVPLSTARLPSKRNTGKGTGQFGAFGAGSSTDRDPLGMRVSLSSQTHAGAGVGVPASAVRSAFPAGSPSRVVEYNGESLEYLKLLGFDSILLSRVPTADLLREAARHDMQVLASPPTAANPDLEPLLATISGWYLGTSQNEAKLATTFAEARRMHELADYWQRPFLVAPAESWERYAGVATSMVYDLPLSARGLSGREEVDQLLDQRQRTGRPVVAAIGVPTMAPAALVDQLKAISTSLGTAEPHDFGWREIILQASRGLVLAPQGIIYRSSRSLASGDDADLRRAGAMAIMNQWIDVVGPLITASTRQSQLPTARNDYVAVELASRGTELIVATADLQQVAVTDNVPLRIPVTGSGPRYAWRLTHTAVEQIPLQGDATSRWLEIENPDFVEWIVVADNPRLSGQLSTRLKVRAPLINQHRWQLVRETLVRSRDDWRIAVGSGLVPRAAVPHDLQEQAARLLLPVHMDSREGRFSQAMRATSAADRMGWLSDRMLMGRLRPAGVAHTGMPTLMAPGGLVTHMAWLPGLEDGRWSDNLLAASEMDNLEEMALAGWNWQYRLQDTAKSHVGLDAAGGEVAGGALRLETLSRGGTPLPGGYAGTVAHVNSAEITFPPGSWVRVRARIKTLGYGGPHQGLLIYDSQCGSELGVLVRGADEWTTIEFFRFITSSTGQHFQVMLEGIGDGEATVDWVRVSMWQPRPSLPPFQPITRATGPTAEGILR